MSRRLPLPLTLILGVFALANLVGALWATPDRGSDFLAFYQSGEAWSAGLHSYRLSTEVPNLTPPLLLPLFSLFALMPFSAALFLWTAVSLACLGAALPTLSQRTGLPWWDLGLLALGSAPGGITLGLGQVGFVLTLAFTQAWTAAQEDRWPAVGGWIGLLCVLKPFYGLFALWLLWRRQWRAVAIIVVVWTAAMAGGLLVTSAGEIRDWMAALGDVSWQANIYNASLSGVSARLFTYSESLRAAQWTPLAESVLAERVTLAGLSLLTFTASGWGLLRHRYSLDRTFVILSSLGLLLSPLGWVHYAQVVIGPLLAIRTPSRWLWVAAVLAFMPYQALLNHTYGPLATLVVGQWACALVASILLVAVEWRPAVTSAPAR